MRSGILLRGCLGLATTLALTTTGLLAFAAAAPAGAASTPSITVTPNSGLQSTGTTSVMVSGSGFADTSAGAILECNSDPSQPTISLLGHPSPVSCGPNPLPGGTIGPNVVSTSATGTFGPKAFTVVTGTVGPPATGTDSSGGDAATDAAKYPCPPTTAQQAAGDTCSHRVR